MCMCIRGYVFILFYFRFLFRKKYICSMFIIRSIFPFHSFFSLFRSLFSHPIYRRNSWIATAKQHWILIVRNKWNKRNKQSKRTNGKIKASELSCAYTHLVSLLDSFLKNREVVSNIFVIDYLNGSECSEQQQQQPLQQQQQNQQRRRRRRRHQ